MENEVFFYDPYQLRLSLRSIDLVCMDISVGFGKGEEIWYKGKPYILDRVTFEDNIHFIYLKENNGKI